MLLAKGYIYTANQMKNSMAVHIAVGDVISGQATVTQGEGAINGSLDTCSSVKSSQKLSSIVQEEETKSSDDQENVLSSSRETSPNLSSSSQKIAALPDSETIA